MATTVKDAKKTTKKVTKSAKATAATKPKTKKKKKKKTGVTEMQKKDLLGRYLDALLKGDRSESRAVIEEAMQTGLPAVRVYSEIIWPIMVEIDSLSRADKISTAQDALATRINRSIVDQLQNKLPRKAKVEKKIVVYSTSCEQGELGGQIIADLFESSGWQVRFVGGGVNYDDLIEFTHGFSPDILLIYGMEANNAPDIRRLIDYVKSLNACPDMRIMLSGGIFDRADGLWEEIGADLYAETAIEAVQIACADKKDVPKPKRTINRRKKRTVEEVAEKLGAAISNV